MTVTLVDDEIPGTVYFEKDRVELLEEAGSLLLKLKRYANDTGELSLRVRTVDGTALAGRDYQALDTVVTFPKGILEKTVTISGPVATDESHPPRKFTLKLSDPAAGTVIGSPGTCAVTVNDKDDPGSTALSYSVPNPETLVRIVDLALDANGVLYALALNSLGAPSAFESRIIKFASDGTGQLLAVVPTGSVYRWAKDIEIAPDGKIYLAGGPVIRFNPNGVRDTSWSSPPLSGSDSFARVLPLPDGKVLVSGNIVNPVGGYTRLKVLRLNSNGTVDPDFDLGSIAPSSGTSWIYDMALDEQGRILIAGEFSAIQGKSRSNVARLSKDGLLDESFTSAALSTFYVSRVLPTPEGKIYTVSDGYTTRLLSNGSRDPTFAPIRATRADLQPDGKLAVCDAINYSFTRYDDSGQIDPVFQPSGSFSSSSLYRILVGPDGRIHASGSFTEADGRAVPMITTLRGGVGAAGGVIEWDISQATVGEGIGRTGVLFRRSGSISGSVGVHYDLVPESAGVGSDVAQLSGFHRFGPGESEHLVELDVLDDSRVEQTESFRVVLHNPAGGALVGPGSNLTFQIIDDDGTSLGDWLARFFPTTPLDRALLGQDSDKDGVPNLVEWMTDSNPSQSGDGKFSQAGSFLDGATEFLGISFYVNAGKAEVQTFVERTSSLNPPAWEVIWDSKLDPDWQSNLIQSFPADGVGWMSIRSPRSGQNSEFFRIRYSSPQ